MDANELAIENNKKSHVFKRLMKYARPYAGRLILSLILVLTITLLDLYRPIILGDAVDIFVESGDFSVIKSKGVLYLLILAVILVCNFFQMWYLELTGQQIVYNIRQEVFEHVHKLSLRFFDVTPVGRIVTRVTNDVESLSEMFSKVLVKLIKNMFHIIGLIVVMLLLDIKLSLTTIAFIPVVGLLTYLFQKISRACHRITRTKISSLNTFLSEHISGMRLIQVFAREPEKSAEFERKSRELYKANFREVMVFAVFRPSIYLLYTLALISVLRFGGLEVLDGGLSVGTLYIFVQYVRNLFDPIQEMAEEIGTMQQALASAEKIFSLLDEEPAIVDPETPVVLPKVMGRIEFDHVWFAYDGENYVLRDVSFVIEPGQRVAFVGATGAGKSSILNLIGRYYDIQKGRILVDGVDIRELSLEELRGAIGQVQQDVFIFTGDIRTNIRLRNEDITDEQVRDAARFVNADSFIETLEHTYEEAVTERGATLSAGQRQLLSFARTLSYDPKILVMDEATANIDTETEQLIQDALERLMRGRTTIMVAHRLSTIQHADRIIVMHKGKIRESGTHQELLAMNGIYKKLYEIQLR